MVDVKAQKAKYAAKKAQRNGADFERLIELSCAHYRQMNLAHVQKTPEPFKLLRKNGKQAIGFYEKKAQPDFTGSLKGGKSIVFEAKHTDATNLPFDRISRTQERDLARHNKLGALAGILISFKMKNFYFVPYEVWHRLKETGKKKSLNQKDLVDYEVSTKKGFIHFLKEN